MGRGEKGIKVGIDFYGERAKFRSGTDGLVTLGNKVKKYCLTVGVA